LLVRKTTREEQAQSRTKLEEAIGALDAGLPPVPEPGEIFVGDGPYLEISREFLGYFVEVAGLRTTDTVLDIGCGIGRMAAGLSQYLDPTTGRYIGFDPTQRGIEWCRTAYADRANFEFHWADIQNDLYNSAGAYRAAEFIFPCEDHSIDLAIATSVFTHLYEDDIRAYLSEAARVLKPGGRLFSTAYLFSGERPVGTRHMTFASQGSETGERWHMQNTPPLAGVCYQEDFFRGLAFGASGRQPIVRPGRWRGGDGPWFQDVVIL
jgi:ubiquinone/menaquinone biosynthesis C-methylase UbiE